MIGLSENELKAFHEKEYLKSHDNRLKTVFPGFEKDLISKGIPPNEARILALSEIQFEANAQATLRTIIQNNERIEAQLKSKGITF